jgi:hypothetical protein
VSIPFPAQPVGIDSAPVVAHDDAQFGGPILHFRLDISRPRMAAGIYNGLTANAVNFVAQPSPQFPFSAMYDHSKACRRGEAQVVQNTGKGLTERWRDLARRAQALHCASSLLKEALHHPENTAKSRLRRGICGLVIHSLVQLHGYSEKSLQERVMEFLPDARAFRKPLFAVRIEVSVEFYCCEIPRGVRCGVRRPRSYKIIETHCDSPFIS